MLVVHPAALQAIRVFWNCIVILSHAARSRFAS
jgi:hypothetical protein